MGGSSAGVLAQMRRSVHGPSQRATPLQVVENFLTQDEVDRLTAHAVDSERAFERSRIVGPHDCAGRVAPELRRSRVLALSGPVDSHLRRRLARMAPALAERLQLAPFRPREVDTQLTATGDGEFFRPHRDAGHRLTTSRAITYVLFLHREPKAFSGGDLCLYPDPGRGPPIRVPPRRNRIVFFPSDVLHEVERVVCATRCFADCRFTLNGWLHR